MAEPYVPGVHEYIVGIYKNLWECDLMDVSFMKHIAEIYRKHKRYDMVDYIQRVMYVWEVRGCLKDQDSLTAC